MDSKILLFFVIFFISCAKAPIVFEENIVKMELSERVGTAPFKVSVKCKIIEGVRDVPCLDEEWYCWRGTPSLASNDFVNKMLVENDCVENSTKREFFMDFTLDYPGNFTIELVLKKKNGEVFARSVSPVIKVMAIF
ncbi:MAG: hypothetical protein ACUVUG_05535 [Candidatus Aminicenantia bacterium]